MSKHIEVGMLVRIIDDGIWDSDILRPLIGHEGKVIGIGRYPNYWVIDGAEYMKGRSAFFHSDHLKPIKPPKEKLGNWDIIENDTGWNPTKQRETI